MAGSFSTPAFSALRVTPMANSEKPGDEALSRYTSSVAATSSVGRARHSSSRRNSLTASGGASRLPSQSLGTVNSTVAGVSGSESGESRVIETYLFTIASGGLPAGGSEDAATSRFRPSGPAGTSMNILLIPTNDATSAGSSAKTTCLAEVAGRMKSTNEGVGSGVAMLAPPAMAAIGGAGPFASRGATRKKSAGIVIEITAAAAPPARSVRLPMRCQRE